MSLTYRIDQKAERITVTAVGDLTFHDLRTTLGVMARDPDFHPRFDRLWDLREAHPELSGNEVREIANSVPHDVGGHHIAIVAPSDVAYGLARMYAVLVEESGLTVRPFREIGCATTWLQESREPCTVREDYSLPHAS